jgi:hypothetical protein
MKHNLSKKPKNAFVVIDKRHKTREEIEDEICPKNEETIKSGLSDNIKNSYQIVYEVAKEKDMNIIVYLPFERTSIFDTKKSTKSEETDDEDVRKTEKIKHNYGRLESSDTNDYCNSSSKTNETKLERHSQNNKNNVPKIIIVDKNHQLEEISEILNSCKICVLSQELYLSSQVLHYAFRKISKDKVTIIEPNVIYEDDPYDKKKWFDGALPTIFNNVSSFDKIYLKNMLSGNKFPKSQHVMSRRYSIFIFKTLNVDLNTFVQEIFMEDFDNYDETKSLPDKNNLFDMHHKIILPENSEILVVPEGAKGFWPEIWLKKKSTNLRFWNWLFYNSNINPVKREIFLIFYSMIQLLLFTIFVRSFNLLYIFYLYVTYITIYAIPYILKYDIVYPDYISPLNNKKMKKIYYNTFTSFDWISLFILYVYPLQWVTLFFSCFMILTKRLFIKCV